MEQGKDFGEEKLKAEKQEQAERRKRERSRSRQTTGVIQSANLSKELQSDAEGDECPGVFRQAVAPRTAHTRDRIAPPESTSASAKAVSIEKQSKRESQECSRGVEPGPYRG